MTVDQQAIQPKEIKKVGNKELKIIWSDGHESVYSFRALRQNCQCALCVDEWSGKGILMKDQIAEDLEGLKVNIKGQYALEFAFSDGHSTGIYPFKDLREICNCERCKK